MKTILLLLSCVVILSDDIENLGVVSQHRAIVLEKCQRRTDFQQFYIEFLPQTWPTNQVTLVTTNELLTLADLAQLPSGGVIMGVKQICLDGAESPINLYRFEIMRSAPSAPRARPTALLNNEPGQSLTNRLEIIRQRRADEALRNTPPIPGQTVTNAPPAQPLPESRSRTYGEHMDEMAQHYRRRGRRSE